MNTNRFYNLEAERQILGTILKDNNRICDVVDLIQANDFSDSKNMIIYGALLDLYKNGKTIDITILAEELLTRLPEVGGITYLSELISTTMPSSLKDYAEIVKEKSNMRNLRKVLQQQMKEMEDGKALSNEIIQTIQNINISTGEQQQIFNDAELMELTMKVIQDNYSRGGGILGIKTNIQSLDMALNGLQKEKLYVIAGRPGMAKSAFALNICQNVSRDYVTAYYSLEMGEQELGLRRLAMTSYIDSARIERGRMSDEEWTVIANKTSMISVEKCFTNCQPGIHLNKIRAQCKQIQLQHGLDLIIIDYLGLMDKQGMGENLREQIGNICIGLKNLSKEFKIPVVILSQINRGPETRADKRPMLSDLKESGGIEENADIVMLLYRDEYYNKDTKDRGILECNIAKQRGGRTGTIKLAWKPEYQKVTDSVKER